MRKTVMMGSHKRRRVENQQKRQGMTRQRGKEQLEEKGKKVEDKQEGEKTTEKGKGKGKGKSTVTSTHLSDPIQAGPSGLSDVRSEGPKHMDFAIGHKYGKSGDFVYGSSDDDYDF